MEALKTKFGLANHLQTRVRVYGNALAIRMKHDKFLSL